MKRVLTVFGTRPEAIKLAPVVERLMQRPDDFTVEVAVTAQHREMLDQVLGLFDITPDYDLDIMVPGQSLTQVTTRVLSGLAPILESSRPDFVIVQGDTTTTFAASLAAFYHRVKVAHVEAGLRTQDRLQPYPEEMSRRLTTQLSDVHFAPTVAARDHLLAEGVADGRIHVTGNTVIDALIETMDEPYEFEDPTICKALESGRRIVLVTAHRRENWGEPMRDICAAVSMLVRTHQDIHVLFAVHLNPQVQAVVREQLGGLERVGLLPPLEYLPFIKLMLASEIILSDSGGVQEEAPSLGKPVLVLREVTERHEAVEAGTVLLVGTNSEHVVAAASRLLTDPSEYDRMSRAANPFGDGNAATRIADVLASL
ncbi:MAG: UDP-N-acetylglucosamine 2-epimerase (non-hydrolyzing) [Anaerosomatales bacterium]|nr:UDP-N-acetylglucosamine 2-epimerase (non-hydrolyzing) [Anaerosomatales bacterium]